MDFKKLLKQIADKEGTTPEAVYRDMQKAIEAADNLPPEAGTTPETVIPYLAARARKKI